MKVSQYSIFHNSENITVNKSDAGESFRMVHDGTNVLALFKSGGFTETRNTLFLAATEQECLDEANRLGLVNVSDHVAELLETKIDDSFREFKVKGETVAAFVGTILSQSDVKDTVLASFETAAIAMAQERVNEGKIIIKDGSKFGGVITKPPSGGGTIVKP